MNIHGNYADLLMLDKDIQTLSQNRALRFFNKEKIERFYDRNSLRLEAATLKMQKLNEKYVQKDAKGEFMKIEEEGVFKTFIFISEEHEKKYMQEFGEFVKTTFTISC